MSDVIDNPDSELESCLNDWIQTEETQRGFETVKNYRSIANIWAEWARENNIESMAEVDGRALLLFKSHRLEQVKKSTTSQNLSCLRRFIKWCQQVEIVEDGLVDKVPDIQGSAPARDEKIDEDTAMVVLEYLERFEYASMNHALFALVWETAMRTGATRSLDLRDLHLDDDAPYIELHHRPETETPLKNKEYSEREVNLPQSVATVLADYRDHNRIETVDDHGRYPLFTTKHGRIVTQTLARRLRATTRPCFYGDACPHDTTIEACEASSNTHVAAQCPSTVSGHPIRRGSITHNHLDKGVPMEVVSDRVDSSVDVLKKNYARQDESTKRQLRREFLDDR